MWIACGSSQHIALLLRIARLHAGVEQCEMALRLGVSQATVSRIERGAASPRPWQARAWLDACAAGAPAVCAVLDHMHAQSEAQRAWALAQVYTQLQLLAQRACSGSGPPNPEHAGLAVELGGAQREREAVQHYLQVAQALLAGDPGCFALRVTGDGMAPLLRPGDTVVVSPAAPLGDGCIVAAYLEPHGAVLRQYCASTAGAELRRLDQPHAAPSTAADAQIWGRVMLLQREL